MKKYILYDFLYEKHRMFFSEMHFMQMITNFIDWYYCKYNTLNCFYIEDKIFMKEFNLFIQEIIYKKAEA